MNEHTKSAHLSILRFWRNLEFFVPFDLDDVLTQDRAIVLHTDALHPDQHPEPWRSPEAYNLNSEWEYGFDLFLLPFAKAEIPKKLSQVLPQIQHEVPSDPREYEGLSCLLRVPISSTGMLLAEDCSISSLLWALDRICKREPLSLAEFDTFATVLLALLRTSSLAQSSEDPAKNSSRFEDEIQSFESLRNFSLNAAAHCELNFMPDNLWGVIVPYPLRRRKEAASTIADDEDLDEEEKEEEKKNAAARDAEILRKKRKVDILNSFYLRDLERAHTALQGDRASELHVLTSYLGAAIDKTDRVDLFTSAAALS
jgi:hypothetical protein